MATISGKRFQITDGASSPTNLFPYTVTEAVYGLSTVIANAISAFQQTLGSMAYETATNYLPKTGGTISNGSIYSLYLNNSASGATYVGQRFQIGGTTYGALIVGTNGNLLYAPNNSDGQTVYHSGNSNKSDVAWQASSLTLSNAYSLKWKNSGGTVINEMAVASDNNLYIGEGQKSTASTFIYGNDIRLCYGSGSLGVILNSSGNVGIGTASPEAKLDVYGGSARFVNGGKAIILQGAGAPWYGTKIYMPFDAGNTYVSCRIGASYTYLGYSIGFANFASSTTQTPANMDGLTYTDVLFVSRSGVLTTTGDQVISSDINLKKNLQDITLTSEQIANAPAVSFDWKDGHGHSFGSIAQYWKPLVPEAVLGEEGSYTLAYGQLGAVLGINNGKAIFKLEQHETEQDKEIKKLKKRVRDLEKQLNIS